MDAKQPTPSDMTVAQLLAQVCRLSGHHLRSHMDRLGLHRGQGFALIHLLCSDGLPQGDLARSMHISPAAVSNMLQRMERDGWIERRRDPEDHRVVRVFASPKGKRLREDARRVFQEAEDEMSAIFSEDEQAALKRLLMKLYEHYAPGEPPPFHLWRLFHDREEAA